jgi:hypothetical protein
MATEKSHDTESVPSEETTLAPEDTSAPAQVPQKRAWYTYLNEDWVATLFGLLLVVLLVVGLLHSIP